MEDKKSFKCPFFDECKRPPFSSRSNLNRHIANLHKSEYRCSYENCDEIFKTRREQILHEKKKHKVKCQLCHPTSPAHFKTLLQLKRHIELVHRKKKRHNVYFCVVCKKSFKSKTEYQLHNVENHSRGAGNFVLHNTAMQGKHSDYR